MEQYIPKSALVAEIENLLKPIKQRLERDKNDPWDSDIAVYKFGIQLIKNIDTLKVKEVDFEKEFCDYFEKNFMIGMTGILLSNNGEPINTIKLLDFAKHFFELGMGVSNKA